jgi:hypothetical protein
MQGLHLTTNKGDNTMTNELYKIWKANKLTGVNITWIEFLKIYDDSFNSYWSYANNNKRGIQTND